jgi:integrase
MRVGRARLTWKLIPRPPCRGVESSGQETRYAAAPDRKCLRLPLVSTNADSSRASPRKQITSSTNPTREVPAPRGSVKTVVVPDRDSIRDLVDMAPDERLRTFIVLAAHTRLRIAEVLSLKWSDVSYEDEVHCRGQQGRQAPCRIPHADT